MPLIRWIRYNKSIKFKGSKTMEIGEKIRELRKAKKITLVELSQVTGVAQATLSRIETGIMRGTVESHEKIARALGLTLAEFYASLDDRADKAIHQDDSKRNPITLRSGKIRCELLTHEAMKKKITPLLLTLEPRVETDSEKLELGVEKFYFVLEGEVTAKIDKKEFILKEGETLYFDASLPHQLGNRGPKKARVFCAVSPPTI